MIWYPYQQLKTMADPYLITDAQGVYLHTPDRKLIDSVSSWWSVIHGYKHPELNRAIIQQVEKFSHVMLGGLTHEPALQLAEKLRQFLPGDLDHPFFSDSGSVAVEVALKMALQYYMNRGESQRTLVLALEHLPALGLEGIVLRWQDTLLGFTLGAPLTETIFDVHFERARGEIQGAYPAVNRSFARYIRQKYPHIRYLDREDDMGLPGLRKAKLSYAPDYLQVNFSAVECRAP